jgi:hypothetical protein
MGQHIDTILKATDRGSVITQDWGIRVLAALSAASSSDEARLFPYLLTFLQQCPPKDLPRHAESCLVAVNPANRAGLLSILEARKPSLKPAQAKRVEQVIRKINAL